MPETVSGQDAPVEAREALRRLLELALAVGGAATVRLKDKDWRYNETLAIKVCQHASSAYFLAESRTKLSPNATTGFVDWPSIQVLCRACIEAYLTLSYVYFTAPSDDIQDFRFASWMIAGFSPRQSFPTLDAAGKKQLEVDAKFLERMKNRVSRTATFQGLSARQQQVVLDGRKWPADETLTSMAAAAYGEQIGAAAYRYLSGFAHSSALSAVQMAQTKDEETIRSMVDGALWLITLTMARTTDGYARKFVHAGKALRQHPDKWPNDIYVAITDIPELA